MKVGFDITIKNDKIFFNKLFWNFDVSEKKSADFSCLFTFFQKNCESKIFFTTFWELHNWQFWIAICLHFWNQLIYVLIQKSKQITNSSCQLCNSQNVVKNIMNLQFFWKNVNKQLKSADFLSETSKFWKILLNKVLAFLIQMSDHTLVFVVQPPNSQKPHTSTHVLLFTFIPLRQNCRRQIFYISLSTTQFWILWKKIQSKLYGKYSKLEKTTKQVQTHKIFIITLIKKFSVADYWYMLYKFTQYTWALSSSLFCHI